VHGPITPTEFTQWRGRAFLILRGAPSDHRNQLRRPVEPTATGGRLPIP